MRDIKLKLLVLLSIICGVVIAKVDLVSAYIIENLLEDYRYAETYGSSDWKSNLSNYWTEKEQKEIIYTSFVDSVDGHAPEPSSLILLSSGLLGIVINFMRKRFQDFKRFFDVFASIFGIIIGLPVMLILGILIKLDSSGSVLYKQVRVGENRRRNINRDRRSEASFKEGTDRRNEERRKISSHGRLFSMYKLRTMKMDAESKTGPVWAKKNDPRITKVGQFLRKFHLDETPQLINVLKGEMSLIGPRPERHQIINELKKNIPNYTKRLKVKPGITGLAQVRYRYDESIEDVKNKLRYDLLYIKKMCWTWDIRVIFLTMKKMLTGRLTR